jgi:hypothetical protein
MRIPSGKTDQLIYFVAVDSTDLKTRETGLSSFTVYRSRNGGVATIYTTPTVAELSSANMPGVYSLVIDEDTTIGASSDSEEYCVHITQASMAPVTRSIELYRRDTTSGQTATVANGAIDADIERIQGTVINAPTVAGVLEVDVTHFNGTAGTFAAGRPEVNTSHAAGTAWGAGAITAASIAADAITAAKIADGAIDAATFAAGAVNAAAIADGAIDAATFAASAINAAAIAADAITAAKIANGAIDAATFAAGAIDAAALATDAGNKIADQTLRRTYANARASSNGDAVNFRSLLGAIGKLVNRWSITTTTLTVYQEDDATSTAPGGTQTITGTAGADPITQIDTD